MELKKAVESEYEKQANAFLKETETALTVAFAYYGRHFEDDKECRDVYDITLQRKGMVYKFKFGQSIRNSQGNPKEIMAYTHTKRYSQLIAIGYKKKCSFVFSDQTLLVKKSIPPTAYDILTCVTKNDPVTFNDFCSEYGYSNDSIKARDLYFKVQEEYTMIHRLFSDVMEKLPEIQ